MSFLDRIRECNDHDLSGFVPFEVAGARVGWVRQGFADLLRPFDDVFALGDGRVALADALADYDQRSRAVDTVLRQLAGQGHIPGWRDEPYPVGIAFTAPPLFQMERAAVPRFGVRAYGVHVNGYVRDGDGLHMWIARRADDKPTYPGMLDNIIAGGQPVGLGLLENVIKEAGEEAGVPVDMARNARPVGAISYVHEARDGLKPDVMFVFDLELPAGFTPVNKDGEIAEFTLLPMAEVMAITETTRGFKFNCALVNIDFFVRHGGLAPDHPDYVEILRGLHR
ncbi:MAG: DUF4743 domain-containing protein [Alphaproteobacteria bacterium]